MWEGGREPGRPTKGAHKTIGLPRRCAVGGRARWAQLKRQPFVAESGRYLEFEADPRREKNAFFAFRLQPDSGAGG